MKILYIEPNNNNNKYLYYTLLYKGLKNNNNIELTVSNTLNNYNLDIYNLIILGYGACARSNYTSNKSILNTKTPIIAFLFKLSIEKEKKFKFLKDNNIIVFGQQTRIYDFEKEFNIKIIPTLYPFDNNLFKNLNIRKKYDIGFTGALHSCTHYNDDSYLKNEKNIRQRICELLQNTNYKKYIKCSDKSYSDSKIVNCKSYIYTINESKIWIATNADYGDLTPRIL